MKAQIALITILTNDVSKMMKFYRDVLGFKVKEDSGNYVEFENEGVRFAICSREIMEKITDGHSAFKEEKRGESFELAFPCETPEEVQKSYDEIVSKGAKPINKPSRMPWGQTTAFFADPDGNIHELFSN
jgi:lactoylglutathione lyase